MELQTGSFNLQNVKNSLQTQAVINRFVLSLERGEVVLYDTLRTAAVVSLYCMSYSTGVMDSLGARLKLAQ